MADRSPADFERFVYNSAVHKAGHAVAAVALGFGLHSATIEVNDDEQGVGGTTVTSFAGRGTTTGCGPATKDRNSPMKSW